MPDVALKFGLKTPILRINPALSEAWQLEAGPQEIRRMAIAADENGFHHVDCAEHVLVPQGSERGERYYDPLASLSFMAAVTRRVRLLTQVLVLPYHHPLVVAKRYGTLDRLSDGRLILGIGVGSLKEEFEQLGVAFEGRGERYTEALQALRSALGQRVPTFEGKFFRYHGMVIDPHAVQAPVPMWLGGKSAISLRRALAIADGWSPQHGADLSELRLMLQAARETPAWRERTAPFEVMFAPPKHDISNDAGFAGMVTDIEACRAAGATVLNLYFSARSIDHYIEQLVLFNDRIAPRFR